MIHTVQEIDRAAALIALIDSGERNVFLECVNTAAENDFAMFPNGEGVFFAAECYGGLRIQISLRADTGAYSDAIERRTRALLARHPGLPAVIWMNGENRELASQLISAFDISCDPGCTHHYGSVEYTMRRAGYNRVPVCGELCVRPYQPALLDAYLSLLDEAMTFVQPRPAYREAREHYAKHFAALQRDNLFEAFFVDGALVGLYWCDGSEVDHIAVAPAYQRRGYGSDVLTCALHKVFATTDSTFARLYAVDWNPQGQAFYSKYGMERSGHSLRLKLPNRV